MAFKKVLAIYYENSMKSIETNSGQNVKPEIVKACNHTYTYHSALKDLTALILLLVPR